MQKFLHDQSEHFAIPLTAAEYLVSQVGRTLTDLFFRPYAKEMWNCDLKNMSLDIVQRIPFRFDYETRYFPNDQYQLLPTSSYTGISESTFNHPNIQVRLDQLFNRTMLDDHQYCFNSMPIDDYYDNRFGPLPYRSIRFTISRNLRLTSWVLQEQSISATTAFIRNKLTGAGCRTITSLRGTSRLSQLKSRGLENATERYYPVKTDDG